MRALRATLLVLIFAFSPTPASAGPKWAPIPPEDLALTKSLQEPSADAEILLRTIRIEDAISGPGVRTEVHHEIRIKVYTPIGAEKAGKVEIAHLKGVNINGITARTVRPDGS